jgi:hypothetical protein
VGVRVWRAFGKDGQWELARAEEFVDDQGNCASNIRTIPLRNSSRRCLAVPYGGMNKSHKSVACAAASSFGHGAGETSHTAIPGSSSFLVIRFPLTLP